MTLASLRRLILAVAASTAFLPMTVAAHDLPVSAVVTTLVKMEADQIHLVVRVPLDVLEEAQFPGNGDLIDVTRSGAELERVLGSVGRYIVVSEDGRPLAPVGAAARLSLPSDRSFEDFSTAGAYVDAHTDPDVAIYPRQGFFDARYRYHRQSRNSILRIQTGLRPDLRDHLKLTVRFFAEDGSSGAFLITNLSGPVALNPTWFLAARGFVAFGIGHILSGIDHLLFLLCLVIPFRRLLDLVPTITAFTIGHSVTLIGTAFGMAPTGLWFSPFVETAIAASIVYMALQNVLAVSLRNRWIIAGLFGLIHGFGFSSALQQDLQFAGRHLLVSLFSFNLGIEIGQLAIIAVMLAGLALLFRGVLAGRMGVIVLSLAVAHTAWHWMVERGAMLWQVQWPVPDGPAILALARWTAGILLAITAARMLRAWAGARWLTTDGAKNRSAASA